MDDTTSEALDSLNLEVEQTNTQEPEPQIPEKPEVDIEELQKKAKLAEDYKKRAEKAEQKLKETSKSSAKSEDNLSQKDIIFLAKAPIHEDDLDDVLSWAKFKGISVQDAYKHMKPTLDVRSEERKTAAATNTKGSARGATKTTGEDYLSRAEKTGEVPESAEGMRALAEARLARLRKR